MINNTDALREALEPCPFCGGEARRMTIGDEEPNNAGGDVIVCTRCQASSHVEFGRKENLVSRWNARPAHSHPQQAMGFADLRDNIRAAIATAFDAGCHAAHENYQVDRDPDFTEAASDYASDAIDVFDMLVSPPALDGEAPEAFAVREAGAGIGPMTPDERSAMIARNCAPLQTRAQMVAAEHLGDPSDWSDKLKELYGWTGSAWLSGEEPEADERRRGEIYVFLCQLIGYFMAGEQAAAALNLTTGSTEAGLSQAGVVDALEPFAALADQLDRIGCDDEDWVGEEESVTLQAKYYRAARQALSKIQPKGDLS